MEIMNHFVNIFLLLLLLFAVVAAFFVLIMIIYLIVAKLQTFMNGEKKKLTSITLQKYTPRNGNTPFVRLTFPDRSYDYYRTLSFNNEINDYVYQYRSVNGTLCPFDYYEDSHTDERLQIRSSAKSLGERLYESRKAKKPYPHEGCEKCLEFVRMNLRGQISAQAFDEGVNKIFSELNRMNEEERCNSAADNKE